jgi:hypothetical protein
MRFCPWTRSRNVDQAWPDPTLYLSGRPETDRGAYPVLVLKIDGYPFPKEGGSLIPVAPVHINHKQHVIGVAYGKTLQYILMILSESSQKRCD